MAVASGPLPHPSVSAQEALWLLAYFAEVLVPDYFGELVGVVVDNQVLDWMVATLRPALARHLQVGPCCVMGVLGMR